MKRILFGVLIVLGINLLLGYWFVNAQIKPIEQKADKAKSKVESDSKITLDHDFTLAISPSKQMISQGEVVTFVIDSQCIGEINQLIELSAISSYEGIDLKMESSSLVVGNSTILTINTSFDIPKGASITIVIVGKVGQHQKVATATLTIGDSNSVPKIADIEDQIVVAGTTTTISVTSSDEDSTDSLFLSLLEAPSYVTLQNNGNGSGIIRIAPDFTETQGGVVTLQVTDVGGLKSQTSFNIKILKPISITFVTFFKRKLTIGGSGFTSSALKVLINDQDVSSLIVELSDSVVVLKGNKKKLKLRNENLIVVSNSEGVMARTSFSIP